MTSCDSSSLRNFLQKRNWCSDWWDDLARVVWEVCSKTNYLPNPYFLPHHKASASATILLCFISPFLFSLLQSSSFLCSSLRSPCQLKHMVSVPCSYPLPSDFPWFSMCSIHHSHGCHSCRSPQQQHSGVRTSTEEMSYCGSSWGNIHVQSGRELWKSHGQIFLVYTVDRSWYGRLARSCSSWAKLIKLIPTLWSPQQAAFALYIFCNTAFAVSPLPPLPCQAQLVSVICDPLKTIWETVVPQSKTQTSDVVTWANEPHATPISTMHGREKTVVREEISLQNQNLCAVWKGSVNAAAALWVSRLVEAWCFFSEVSELLCVSVVTRMETFLIIHASVQVGSLKTNCDMVKIISDCPASYRFLPSTVFVLLSHLYGCNLVHLQQLRIRKMT